MNCPYCGHETKGGEFCPMCGGNIANLHSQPVDASGIAQPVGIPPITPEASRYPEAQQTPDFAPVDNVVPQNGDKEAPKGKPKRKGLMLGLIIGGSVLLLGVILAVLFIFVFPNGDASVGGGDVELTELQQTLSYIASDEREVVLFTVKSSGPSDNIFLYEDGVELSKMYDDGTNGDAVADDNIYSCQLDIKKKVNNTRGVVYSCQADGNASNETTIYFFAPLTEGQAAAAKSHYNNLADEVADCESNYADASGYVPESSYAALIEDITTVLDDYQARDVILHYFVEENSIFIKMTSGLAMVYEPKTQGTDSIGDEPANMISFQPCYTEMGGAEFGADFTGYTLPLGCSEVLGMQDAAAGTVSATLPNFSFRNSNNCNDEAVTLERIRSITDNQVVLIHTHGYYGPIVKSCLKLGEAFDWDAWWFNWQYYTDCVSNRIVNGILLGYDNVIISSGYIEKRCGTMTNSLIYLGACKSGSSAHLAQAFLDKGAGAVVANSDTIRREYNVAMIYGTITEMVKVNATTGSFNTLSEALANAMSTYGTSDADARYGGVGAYPIIFGGETANNYRLADEVPTGVINGKVCMASDRVTPIANATIEVYIDDVLYDTTVSDANGQYTMELPIGLCKLQITASGYLGYSCYTDVYAGSDIQIETFLMVFGQAGETGIADGTIYNSISGQGVAGATLKFLKNWNSTEEFETVVKTTTTNSNGEYMVVLERGNYTVIVEKEGYSKSSFNIIIQEGETPNQDGVITPVITGDDYLITLTWDENPRDVDSHLYGYDENGNSFHVYYSNKIENGCELDYDDTTSYGPEHITLSAEGTQPYYYYLYKYAGDGPLSSSGATVTVEQNNVVIAIFHVPTNQGAGNYWNVFCIKDGEIYVQNTITDSADTSYADNY